MGIIQKDAFRTMLISYGGLLLGYLNKGFLFILLLTSEQIGLVNLLVAVGLLLAQLANFGTIYSVWKFFPFFRNISKNHYGFLFLNVLIVLVGLSICCISIFLFQADILAYYAEKSGSFVDYFYLIFPIGISTVFFLLFENYMRGLNQNILPVFLNEFFLRIMLSVLLVCFSLTWISFDTFLIVYSLAHFIPGFILLIHLIRIKELKFSLKNITVPKRFKRIIIQYSLFSYLNSIGALVVVTMDAMMIAAMLGLEETGVYTTVVYLVSAISVPYKSLLRISSPFVPLYWKEKKLDKMNELYKQVSSVSLIFVLFFFALVWINRTALFSFLGPEFQPGIYVFLFIMVGRILDMYLGLNGVIFYTSKKYKYDLLFTVFLIGIVFVLNLWLIPIYGMIGAAISTGFALIVYNLGRVAFVYFVYKMHPFEKHQFYVLGLFGSLIAFFEFFYPVFDNRIISIGIACVLFALLFFVPILKLNWNKDLEAYFQKGLLFVKQKALKK